MALLVVVVGRGDTPTDGVEDYCRWLCRALGTSAYGQTIVRVPWIERGWVRAVADLWSQCSRWRGTWVLVQYTAMSWSRRGFPVRFLVVIGLLRLRSCRVGVVYHDAGGFPGSRWIDRLRRACQHWVMRRAYHWAHRAILNVPVDRATWLPRTPVKARFIPVGANIPAGSRDFRRLRNGAEGASRRVAVFGVTGGRHAQHEVEDIALAVRRAREVVPRLHLVVLGRGSREAEPLLRQALDDSSIEVSVLGLMPAEDVARVLAEADAMLFVRGPLTSQRSSGIAGLACGLPIVAYSGPHTAPPLTDAGVILVPYRDREALAGALARVLADARLLSSLRERSAEAYRRHFAWDAIAARYAEALGLPDRAPGAVHGHSGSEAAAGGYRG